VSRANVARLGGVAAALGGAFSAVLSAVSCLLMSTVSGPVPGYFVGPLATLADVIVSLLYTAGLVGLYSLLGRRSNLGLSELLLALLSFLASLSPVVFAVVYFAHHLLITRRQVVPSPGLIFPGQIVDLIGIALLAGGVLLLAVAALGARVLGRWTPLPFVLALLTLLPVLASYVGLGWMPYALFGALSVLRGLCWTLVGGALWARAPHGGSQTVAGEPAGG
jgi:hypothetical protein